MYLKVKSLLLSDGLATIAYITDISESQKAELDLRKSEAKFRSVFESEMIGILFSDSKGNIHDANDAFLKLLGYQIRVEQHFSKLEKYHSY